MKNNKKVYILFFVVLIIFFSGFSYLFLKINNLEKLSSSLKEISLSSENGSKLLDLNFGNTCTDECKKEIEEMVSQAISTVSAVKTVTETTRVVSESEPKIAYVPLSGPITSTSVSWVDAIGTDVYIDLANDYSKNAKVSWEAFLKVAHGNGQAYARLFDVTHGIAVAGSEISVTNTDISTQVSSGSINFWSGRNLYRVQIKSLNSFEVTFGSGRIKISY